MESYYDKAQLSFSDALRQSTSKLFTFEGRARRSEFWWTWLTAAVLSVVLAPVAFIFRLLMIPITFRRLHDVGRSGWWWAGGFILAVVFVVKVFVDVFAIALNEDVWDGEDVAYWMHFFAGYALWFLALIAWRVLLLVFLCLDSQRGPNRFGPSPKYGD